MEATTNLADERKPGSTSVHITGEEHTFLFPKTTMQDGAVTITSLRREANSQETSPIMGHKPSISSDSGAHTDADSSVGDLGVISDRATQAEESSDSDAERILDPAFGGTGKVILRRKKKDINDYEGIKERPMSWEGTLTEEQDAVMESAEGPGSPMTTEEQQDPIQKAEQWVRSISPRTATALYPPSPELGRHQLNSSGFSSPFSATRSLSRNNSDASQYSYSPSPGPGPRFWRDSPDFQEENGVVSQQRSYVDYHQGVTTLLIGQPPLDGRVSISIGNPLASGSSHMLPLPDSSAQDDGAVSVYQAQAGISRQQLINSPCPICGDKISGFHYGIFSCESCKGFFKRTVQNKKNYVCVRGASCPVTIATRKKCPACRFDKCLKVGMKLEAIREDRTRGGRSTYQCSYTIPPQFNSLPHGQPLPSPSSVKSEPGATSAISSTTEDTPIPVLLQQIMGVEHLWHSSEGGGEASKETNKSTAIDTSDSLSHLCSVADHRLYKIVKWCKSLPLFQNITIDDQIALLINAWCELLVFSCCYRSVGSPGEIRISLGKSVSKNQAREMGLSPCIDRMLSFTEHLRRLRVDRFEYVALKVIILLTSDTSGLKLPEKVRESQEKVLQALQQYTLTKYPDVPSKFGELLLRIPELERLCQVGKELLSMKSTREDEKPSFNLLMELLRGEH